MAGKLKHFSICSQFCSILLCIKPSYHQFSLSLMPTHWYMIKQALNNLKINALNPMQEAAIAAAKKSDVILLSPTGSGKTLGFLLPLLGLLDASIPTVQAMILVPSRELALQ